MFPSRPALATEMAAFAVCISADQSQHLCYPLLLQHAGQPLPDSTGPTGPTVTVPRLFQHDSVMQFTACINITTHTVQLAQAGLGPGSRKKPRTDRVMDLESSPAQRGHQIAALGCLYNKRCCLVGSQACDEANHN